MKGAFYVGPPLLSDLSGRRKNYLLSPFFFFLVALFIWLPSAPERADENPHERATDGAPANEWKERGTLRGRRKEKREKDAAK